MNENILNFLKNNAKYIIIILVGVIILVLPSVGDFDTKGNIESELKNILSMVEGVGDLDVMVSFDGENVVKGAIIVAEGAENSTIRKMLQDSAVSVLNLPEYKVKVLTKKK